MKGADPSATPCQHDADMIVVMPEGTMRVENFSANRARTPPRDERDVPMPLCTITTTTTGTPFLDDR